MYSTLPYNCNYRLEKLISMVLFEETHRRVLCQPDYEETNAETTENGNQTSKSPG